VGVEVVDVIVDGLEGWCRVKEFVVWGLLLVRASMITVVAEGG